MWKASAERLNLRSSRDHDFDVTFCPRLDSEEFRRWLAVYMTDRVVLAVITPTVDRLYGASIRGALADASKAVRWLVLDCTEPTKTMDYVLAVCSAATEAQLDRRGALVAVGGGVCSDIVTLAASMLRRGLSHFRIPTTLIGQIDAGIGLKGGVNFLDHKNHLGCFYPPDAVAVVPSCLVTLPTDGIRQGLAEMIKIACTTDPELFALMERTGGDALMVGFRNGTPMIWEPMHRAIVSMLSELSKNPFETATYERGVDFGHTLAHPLEASTGYRLHHGFAVAIDIAFSSILSWRMGWLSEETATRIIALLEAAGLPVWHASVDEAFVAQCFKIAAAHRGGEINMVLPSGIGEYRFLKRSDQCPSNAICETVNYVRLRGGQQPTTDSAHVERASRTGTSVGVDP